MKRFLKQIVVFSGVLVLIFIIGIALPATPASKNNMLSYKIQKDSLLIHTKSPRMIFVGGSNLVFGLNSHLIKDSLSINPINNGLAINLGLEFMIDDVLPYVREGDCVILAPEYQHFYGRTAYGNNDLLRLILDVDHKAFKRLSYHQIPNLIKVIPNYFISKFNPHQYFWIDKENAYSKYIFNEFGDSDYHWTLETVKFPVINEIHKPFNNEIFNRILQFNKELNDKGAKLYITYPGCQNKSMQVIQKQIDQLEDKLGKTGLKVLGTPKEYGFSDVLMFDSPYHLNKEGVDIRTQLFIEDYREYTLRK